MAVIADKYTFYKQFDHEYRFNLTSFQGRRCFPAMSKAQRVIPLFFIQLFQRRLHVFDESASILGIANPWIDNST